MIRQITLVLLLATVAFGFRIRRNSYGDEPVTPQTGGNTPASEEEMDASTVAQGGGAQTNVESSGYRVKRAQNGYGDEAVTPAGGGGGSVHRFEETNPVTVEAGGNSQGNVQSSGY